MEVPGRIPKWKSWFQQVCHQVQALYGIRGERLTLRLLRSAKRGHMFDNTPEIATYYFCCLEQNVKTQLLEQAPTCVSCFPRSRVHVRAFPHGFKGQNKSRGELHNGSGLGQAKVLCF